MWKDNIKTDLKETECEGVKRIDLAQDVVQWRALLNTAVKLWVHKRWKFLE
jgi:hypothetical protein